MREGFFVCRLQADYQGISQQMYYKTVNLGFVSLLYKILFVKIFQSRRMLFAGAIGFFLTRKFLS